MNFPLQLARVFRSDEALNFSKLIHDIAQADLAAACQLAS